MLCRVPFGGGCCHNVSVDFEALANEHKDAVYRQMLRVCGNHADAEDVLIEALLRAYRHLDQLRDSVAFRSWLAQIAKRVCWQLKERQALMPLMQLSTLEDEGTEIAAAEPSLETRSALRQVKELLTAAVNQLPPAYRAVYELRDLEELPGEVVAKRLGISLAAMKSRLNRARTMVRQQIDAALAGGAPAGTGEREG